MPTLKFPEMMVTFSVVGWLCAGTWYPAGSFTRTTYGPLAPGSPDRTANCAPLGSVGGDGPHLSESGVATVISSAKPADAVSDSARTPSASLSIFASLDLGARSVFPFAAVAKRARPSRTVEVPDRRGPSPDPISRRCSASRFQVHRALRP